MDLAVQGILIPIHYSTNTPQHQGYIELYFSQKPEKIEKDLPASLKNAWQKAEQRYRHHHVYGDHQFLIPVKRDGWILNSQFGSMQIGNNPTTSTQFEKLQLMPCSQSNLSLICQLQSQPFYIEIAKRSFYLHVLIQGVYCKIQSQKAIPKNWAGFIRPVITLVTDSNPIHFSNLLDIPWLVIAQQLCSKEKPLPMQIIESPCYSYC
jgi:hypothetical protein